MKKFLLRVLLFSSLTVTMTLVVIFTLNWLVASDDFFRIDQDVKYIVVGDSHPECAFNDSLIDHFQNFGQSGEAYFYSYLKTKKLLENNPNIETVFVELNLGQILKNIDKNTWDDVHIAEKYQKYFFAMNADDYNVLMKNNFSGFLNAQSISIKTNLTMLRIEDRTMHDLKWGGYNRLTNNGQDKLKDLEDKEMIANSKIIEHSDHSLNYLYKLVEICQDHTVKVVFVRAPVHRKHAERRNEKTFEFLRNKYFKDIPFLDYQDIAFQDFEFADTHHLNFLGADRFSKLFNEDLKGMDK